LLAKNSFFNVQVYGVTTVIDLSDPPLVVVCLAVDINQKNFYLDLIILKDRRPIGTRTGESNRTRIVKFNKDNFTYLPDRRLKVSWEKHDPRFYKNYKIKW